VLGGSDSRGEGDSPGEKQNRSEARVRRSPPPIRRDPASLNDSPVFVARRPGLGQIRSDASHPSILSRHNPRCFAIEATTELANAFRSSAKVTLVTPAMVS